jgi:hydroxyacylglutathione hydrolase
VEEILPGVVRVNDADMDTSYVLRGEHSTGVIDTGMGIGDLAAVVRRVSAAPPLVINTHCHPDHWQGNWQFDETTMSAAEWDWIQTWQLPDPGPDTPSALDFLELKRPLPPGFDRASYSSNRVVPPTRMWQDGDTIDLGGFRLEVVAIPAHTPGGIALLERERRILFTGDTVLRGRIWLHLPESSAHAELGRTYTRLAALDSAVDWVLPAHGVTLLPGRFLRELNEGIQRMLRGEIAPSYEHTFAGDGWFYDLAGYGPLLREKV